MEHPVLPIDSSRVSMARLVNPIVSVLDLIIVDEQRVSLNTRNDFLRSSMIRVEKLGMHLQVQPK